MSAENRSVGRPTKFDPKFCELLTQHMSVGLSFESFAGRDNVDVSASTLYEWVNNFPEFSEAKKRGNEKSRLRLETEAMKSITGKNKAFNTTAWIFMMKNRFKWADRVIHEGNEEKPIQLAYDPTKLRPRKNNEE